MASYKNRQMSANFTLGELTFSSVANKHGLSNIPNIEQIKNLQRLCDTILQPIRDKFGKVIITSAFRNSVLNGLVGGSPTSDHLHGLAADIFLPDADMREVALWCCENLVFHQLIDCVERSNFIHISTFGKPHRQTLIQDKDKNYRIVKLEDYVYNMAKLIKGNA